MHGNLIYGKYTSHLYRLILRADGKGVIPQSDPPLRLVGEKGLGVTQAPDGSLFQPQFSLSKVVVHIPDERSTNLVKVNSVFPRRGPVAGGSTLTLYGKNLKQNGKTTTVRVGGTNCPIQSSTAVKIKCTLPGGSGTVDITVSVGTESYVFRRGYRFITGVRA